MYQSSHKKKNEYRQRKVFAWPAFLCNNVFGVIPACIMFANIELYSGMLYLDKDRCRYYSVASRYIKNLKPSDLDLKLNSSTLMCHLKYWSPIRRRLFLNHCQYGFNVYPFEAIYPVINIILFRLHHLYWSSNSLGQSDAYMRQWFNHHWFRQWLVAWSLPNHYLNQCWNIVSWTFGNKLQWNLNQNSYIFIQENAFENVVWKMAAILSRLQCVKHEWHAESGLVTTLRGPIQYRNVLQVLEFPLWKCVCGMIWIMGIHRLIDW